MTQKKKQPINVQLSKEDLVELLRTIKDFTTEEISHRSGRLFLNQHEMDRRITDLEIVENSRLKETFALKLKLRCSHDNRLDHISYSLITGNFLAAVYKCEKCGLEDRKARYFLTRKEKRALRKLGVKI